MSLTPRHIQNFSEASALEPHWGYADRVVPCTNDAGSCEYLDVVYWAHDVGMIYVGIMWIVILGLLLLFGVGHRFNLSSTPLGSRVTRWKNRYLLPEFRSLRFLFGRTTRLQVIVLAAISAYLFVFSFAGMTYQIWITPVKNLAGVYNTRTTLGPWSDRVGVLAYALTPLSILLSSRESLLSVVTGIPYHHFNFLHRWIGHIILAQSVLHTIGWCIIEIRLYQPQPSVAVGWITQTYMIWGVVALILLLILWGLATRPAQRAFGYEFFKKAHYVLAMLYIGAAIGHWPQLSCFLISSILLWGIDRAIRLGRTALIHYHLLPSGSGVFASIPAALSHFGSEGDVVRIDLINPNPIDWDVGQHFYLTFPKGSIWQSHPFTPLSLPGPKQSYLLRAKRGETRKLMQFEGDETPVILTGPYGSDVTKGLDLGQAGLNNVKNGNADGLASNVLCIAGGTGITFVLPVLMRLAQVDGPGKVELIWVVRRSEDEEWIKPELDYLRRTGRVDITIHATRSPSSSPTSGSPASSSRAGISLSSSGSRGSQGEEAKNEEAEDKIGEDTSALVLDSEKGTSKSKATRPMPELEGSHRPDLHIAISTFTASCHSQPVRVYVSGPGGMITATRETVAGLNGRREGINSGGLVDLIYDERLE